MVAIDEKSVRGSDAVRRRTRPLVNNLYQGMTLDAVTGLYYEPNRDYSPSLGLQPPQSNVGAAHALGSAVWKAVC